MRGGCGPPCSFELNQALRHARSTTAKGRRAAACWSTRDTPMWSDARRLWAAVQLWAEPGATLCPQRDGHGSRRSGELCYTRRSEEVTRGGCGPLCSLKLNQARRSARSGTGKGRDAAASCATRNAPRWSDARRLWAGPRGPRSLRGSHCWRCLYASAYEAPKGARLEVSCSRRPRVAEQLEAAKGARVDMSGARRPKGHRTA